MIKFKKNFVEIDRSKVVVDTIVQSYWNVNEDRIGEWIEERLEHDNDTPKFDTFLVEFPYNVGFEDPSVGEMLNEQLDHFDLAGLFVTKPLVSEFERVFEAKLAEILADRKKEKLDALELRREYREVG